MLTDEIVAEIVPCAEPAPIKSAESIVYAVVVLAVRLSH